MDASGSIGGRVRPEGRKKIRSGILEAHNISPTGNKTNKARSEPNTKYKAKPMMMISIQSKPFGPMMKSNMDANLTAPPPAPRTRVRSRAGNR